LLSRTNHYLFRTERKSRKGITTPDNSESFQLW
jgi:hypothetical protein